ncbi:Uricase [Hypsizygus marmoreus]|uniref:factor independent urate hydroxylase n=1 Tax=Hypsizygus marmoreus TaxID=39966 RepID=A0A369JAB8_HYPMA|nr:Uricase [Hypsizygus marmoreus]
MASATTATQIETTLTARYGKDKVRVLRVVRDGKWHHVVEYNVTALLEGDIETSYTQADNSVVVATDSVKNITYYLAKVSPHILNPERFALHLGTHLVSRYAHIHKAFVTVEQLRWSRIPVADEAKGHTHAFFRDGEDKRVVKVEVDGSAGKDKLIGRVQSGISELLVLKTTGSAFENFVRDEYTTLAEVSDRIFSTSVDLAYTFAPIDIPAPKDEKKLEFEVPAAFAAGGVWDSEAVAGRAREVTLSVFADDDSASVQATLYKMAQLVIAQNAGVQSVTYVLPNKHYIPVDMKYLGVDNVVPPSSAEVFMPIAAPRGVQTLQTTFVINQLILQLHPTMGGDHKCPVCQATFTRPQHVARHMRSHTGDRPYKCQYCGDQFARSDLLSRHVNKCHANEKPLPSLGSRRKGSASASRATTSKQACDQCVQSSLPCDGCNPCAKCVQRKYRCTFVKFHRQTAPTGPGHNPVTLTNPPSSSRTAMYPSSRHTDEFLLGPAPLSAASSGSSSGHTMADNLFTDNFSFGPLYPTTSHPASASSPTLSLPHDSSADYAQRYRVQADLLRRNAMAAAGSAGHGPSIQDPIPSNLYADPRSVNPSSWTSWGQTAHPEDKDMQADMSQQFYGTSALGSAPPFPVSYITDRRRPSLDFSSDGSSASHSVPSSATSSSVHLPMESMPVHQTFPGSALSDSSFVPSMHQRDHHQHPHQPHAPDDSRRTSNTAAQHQHRGSYSGEGGFSSAFGLMSIDDPNVLAGLSSDGVPFFSQAALNMDTGDPNATPMPMPHPASSQVHQQQLPPRPNTHQGYPTPARDTDTRELREFWKQYMRTPLSGPGPSALYSDSPSAGTAESITPSAASGGSRRQRVASLPSAKTPTNVPERYIQNHGHNTNHQPSSEIFQYQHPPSPKKTSTSIRGNGRAPPPRTTAHAPEDLRSYEAAVLARRAPTTLSLPQGSKRSAGSLSASPQVPPRGPPGGEGDMEMGTPGSTDTRPTTSTSSSSLANVFGTGTAGGGVGAGMRVMFAGNAREAMEYAASASSASPDVRSRESSVAVSDGGSGESEPLRPSFKRLSSQTLGPENSKRVLLMRDEDGGSGGGRGSGGGGVNRSRPIATLAERRRRMSAPSGTSPTSLAFNLGPLDR